MQAGVQKFLSSSSGITQTEHQGSTGVLCLLFSPLSSLLPSFSPLPLLFTSQVGNCTVEVKPAAARRWAHSTEHPAAVSWEGSSESIHGVQKVPPGDNWECGAVLAGLLLGSHWLGVAHQGHGKGCCILEPDGGDRGRQDRQGLYPTGVGSGGRSPQPMGSQ